MGDSRHCRGQKVHCISRTMGKISLVLLLVAAFAISAYAAPRQQSLALAETENELVVSPRKKTPMCFIICVKLEEKYQDMILSLVLVFVVYHFCRKTFLYKKKTLLMFSEDEFDEEVYG